MKAWARSCLLLSVLSCAGGCYTTTIRSGAAPGRTPVGYDAHWHDGFWWGLAEAEGPYDINRICPEGWAEVTTELDFPAGLLAFFTAGVYYPQRVTLVCAAAFVPPAPMPAPTGSVAPSSVAPSSVAPPSAPQPSGPQPPTPPPPPPAAPPGDPSGSSPEPAQGPPPAPAAPPLGDVPPSGSY